MTTGAAMTPEGRVTLWGIEVFLAAAASGSVSMAAQHLGASASAISQQLAGLEAALGAVLLDRSARPMRMTPAGAMFHRHAQTIINAAAEARQELALADLSGLTTLRLGVIEDFDADVTPRLLADLAQDLRTCRFLLETGASHRLIGQAEARALDIVVAADLGAALEGFEVHPLLADPFVVVTAKGALQDLDLARELQALPLIRYSTRHHMGRQIAAHLAQQNLRLSPRFELDSYHAILAMVAEGAGWTILTPLALHHAARFLPQVEVRPLPFGSFARRITLSARAGIWQDIPAQIAHRLQGQVATRIIAPAVAEWPWLHGELRLL